MATYQRKRYALSRYFDYPGEWLLDLPLLSPKLSAVVSRNAADHAKPTYGSQRLVSCGESFRSQCECRRRCWHNWQKTYTDYLLCKQEGLHFIQPGRFVLPGELEAPALQFFHCCISQPQIGEINARKNKVAILPLTQRYELLSPAYCESLLS